MQSSSSTKTRRRGPELDEAIIEAAWAELAEHGYAGLTMETVATRARTSRSVLARRWNGKALLAIAAIQWQLAKHPLDVPDRGSVRKELLEYLDRLSDLIPFLDVVFSVSLNKAFRETYASPQALRKALNEGRPPDLGVILSRGVARGEIDPAKLIAPIESLLSDLIRHHVLMNRSAPSKRLRANWVDAIFLPLVRTG
ncbi:TetR/AcrR family transcriptional regulator [Allopusillimonas ginsengisoli]|uniref:TetR/AcrR family transcriptional regulator n=1 Tax=Allopusillimonas ginsengisoli TaxID=453575 RepID=UPI001021A622|nr:TetR/AcrR family transcriptional regulator [Allopusillimonas ginsengisoli]TEA77740.1 TetR/AcrR family transcriptional regulator [Allopusillimonas ginsengisoli]